MTTGSWTKDERYRALATSKSECWQVLPYIGNLLVGPYEKRTWSGANAPARSDPPSQSEGFTYLVPQYSRKGGTEYISGYKERHRFYTRKRVDRRKLLGEHPYTMSSVRFVGDLIERRFACPAGTVNHPYRSTETTSNSFLPASAPQRWTPNDDIALYGSLRERIQGDDFNLGVTLGEGKESLKTIADGATRIAKSLRALKKGRAVQAWNYLVVGRPKTGRVTYYKDGKPLPRVPSIRDIPAREVTKEWIAGSWLQYQYGWRPLIQDVYSASRHLAYMLNSDRNKTYRVSRRVPADESWHYISIYYPDTCVAYTRKSIVARIRTVDEVGLVGLKDPASVAWELVPYSFVVDWFIPIGNYLSAKDLSRRISGTFIVSTKVYSRMSGLRHQGDIYSGGKATLSEVVSFKREIFSSLPSVSMPVVNGYNKIATWTHAASAISLILATLLPGSK